MLFKLVERRLFSFPGVHKLCNTSILPIAFRLVFLTMLDEVLSSSALSIVESSTNMAMFRKFGLSSLRSLSFSSGRHTVIIPNPPALNIAGFKWCICHNRESEARSAERTGERIIIFGEAERNSFLSHFTSSGRHAAIGRNTITGNLTRCP